MRFPDLPTRSSAAVLSDLASGEWLAEYKFDGWRSLIEIRPDTVFTSRHGYQTIPASAPIRGEVADLDLPVGTILDGEYMGRRAGQSERVWLFDVLRIGTRWILDIPAIERFKLLVSLVPMQWIVGSSLGGYLTFFESSKLQDGCEGIVLKRIDSQYIASVRECRINPAWLKVKFREGADGKVMVA